MDLYSYLLSRDGKVERTGAECCRVARDAETTPYYLYMLALGHKSPSLPMAQRIAAATGDIVEVAQWPARPKEAA